MPHFFLRHSGEGRNPSSSSRHRRVARKLRGVRKKVDSGIRRNELGKRRTAHARGCHRRVRFVSLQGLSFRHRRPPFRHSGECRNPSSRVDIGVSRARCVACGRRWIPAFAGMTSWGKVDWWRRIRRVLARAYHSCGKVMMAGNGQSFDRAGDSIDRRCCDLNLDPTEAAVRDAARGRASGATPTHPSTRSRPCPEDSLHPCYWASSRRP